MVLGAIKKGFQYLITRPYTRQVPEKSPPFKTETTRGTHVLYMERCTGCTMCQLVCPADAIKMIKVEGVWKMNRKKIFPGVDYQRCTFCAMCVEVCPTSALAMTNVTGWELTTTDTRKTLKMPWELKLPEGAKLTVVKQKKWPTRPPMAKIKEG